MRCDRLGHAFHLGLAAALLAALACTDRLAAQGSLMNQPVGSGVWGAAPQPLLPQPMSPAMSQPGMQTAPPAGGRSGHPRLQLLRSRIGQRMAQRRTVLRQRSSAGGSSAGGVNLFGGAPSGSRESAPSFAGQYSSGTPQSPSRPLFHGQMLSRGFALLSGKSRQDEPGAQHAAAPPHRGLLARPRSRGASEDDSGGLDIDFGTPTSPQSTSDLSPGSSAYNAPQGSSAFDPPQGTAGYNAPQGLPMFNSPQGAPSVNGYGGYASPPPQMPSVPPDATSSDMNIQIDVPESLPPTKRRSVLAPRNR